MEERKWNDKFPSFPRLSSVESVNFIIETEPSRS